MEQQMFYKGMVFYTDRSDCSQILPIIAGTLLISQDKNTWLNYYLTRLLWKQYIHRLMLQLFQKTRNLLRI